MIKYQDLSESTKKFIAERAEALGITIEDALKYLNELLSGTKVSKHLQLFA